MGIEMPNMGEKIPLFADYSLALTETGERTLRVSVLVDDQYAFVLDGPAAATDLGRLVSGFEHLVGLMHAWMVRNGHRRELAGGRCSDMCGTARCEMAAGHGGPHWVGDPLNSPGYTWNDHGDMVVSGPPGALLQLDDEEE